MDVFLDTGVRNFATTGLHELQYFTDGGFSDIHTAILDERPVMPIWKIMRWRPSGAKGMKVAVKVIRTSQNMDSEEHKRVAKDLMNEIEIWSRLEHFNILPLLGIVHGVLGRTLPSLVSPWCEPGTVSKYIMKHPRAADRISLVLQAASAVSYLHSCKPPIIHGDLKADNFLLRPNHQVQLSDFGLSKIPRKGVHSRFSKSLDGSVRWMSPELLSGGAESNESIPTRSLASDIWALGCTFYEVLTSSIPFHHTIHEHRVILLICQEVIPKKPTCSESEELAHLQDTLWPVLEASWNHDMLLRPEIDEIMYRLHEAILTRESHQFYGSVFHYDKNQRPPSVVGGEEPPVLATIADSQKDETQRLAFLAGSAIGYHCERDKSSACVVQAKMGSILVSLSRFAEARMHLDIARHVFESYGDFHSAVSCQLGLATAAQSLDEKVERYTSALLICRRGAWADQEAVIIRALGNTTYEQVEHVDPREKEELLSRARNYFAEALSLYIIQRNLELQVQVRCELVELELEAGKGNAAQTHAEAAFHCAQETGDRNLVEDVYDYLTSTDVLSEATCNAFDLRLRKMAIKTLEDMLKAQMELFRPDSALDDFDIVEHLVPNAQHTSAYRQELW